MLSDLHIRNIAIIDDLHVPFGPGLNVLTGETGAGKSIVIDAVNLVMGGRGGSDLIRHGAEEGVVEALFDLSDRPDLLAYLEECGIDCDGELLVRRVVARSGRNRVFVGGGMSTVSALADVARRLLNIYGQHESQTLLKAENHLLLLDGFAGLEDERRHVAELYGRHRALNEELQRLESGERDAVQRLDLLQYQVGEIAAATLVPGEEEELEAERQVLLHAGKLLQAATVSYDRLYEGEGSVIGALREVSASLADAGRIDAALAPLLDGVESAYAAVEDVALSLRDYATRIEADPGRLDMVDERLDRIRNLKKKYGGSIDEILRYRESALQEVEKLQGGASFREEISRQLTETELQLRDSAEALSRARQEAAPRLALAMEGELRELAMREARFTVQIDRLQQPREAGIDAVGFLFSPNPGEGFRPLARIASGGELSRLMLAIKRVHPESDVPTLIFDEVDTGIGGATSAVVGEKLKKVSRSQQVLCITHIPQVAAFADRQYKVEKRVEGGRTSTAVTLLNEGARVEELARMSGGAAITETTLRHAREMVAAAAVNQEDI